MTVVISQSIIDAAIALNESGDLVAAYQLLADAGDMYAAAALKIVDDEPDIFESTVNSFGSWW